MSIRLILLAAAVNLSLMLAGLGMAGPDQDERNAATWYRRAFERMNSMSAQDVAALVGFGRTPGRAADPHVRRLLAQMQPILDLAARGNSEATCDFQVQYHGVETVITHTGDMRKLTGLLQADAMVRFSDGDATGAARQLGQAYRMSDQLSHDGVAINSLVGAAIFNSADALAMHAIDQGQISSDQARVLLEATDSISRDDPFGFIRSMEGEKTHLIGWAREQFSGEGGVAKFKEQFPNWVDIGANQGLQLEMTSQAELDFSLQQADAVMDRAIEAMNMPDPIDAKFELAQLEKEIAQGEHGLAAMLMMPAFAKYYETMSKTREKLDERRAMLQELAEGRAQPQEMINAAIAYLEAIRRIEALEPAKWELIAAAAKSGIPPVDNLALQSLDQSIKDTAEIVTMLHAASLRRRCDFSIAQERRPSATLTYAGGMRDAARLLLAAAVMQREREQPDQAAANLAVTCRMIRHLASDRAIASSLASYGMLCDTADEVWRLSAVKIPEASRGPLAKAVARLAEKDSLSFRLAVEADRVEVSAWLRQLGLSQGVPSTQWAAAMRRLDAIVLLQFAAAADVQRGAADESNARRFAARLGDLVDVEALLTARAASQSVVERCRLGDMMMLSEQPEKPIAQIDRCISDATQRLTRMQELLAPAASTQSP